MTLRISNKTTPATAPAIPAILSADRLSSASDTDGFRVCGMVDGSMVKAIDGFRVGGKVSVSPPGAFSGDGVGGAIVGVEVGLLLLASTERMQGASLPSSQYTSEARMFDSQQSSAVPPAAEQPGPPQKSHTSAQHTVPISCSTPLEQFD